MAPILETAEAMRFAHRQAQRWRDLLWQSVVEEMAERDPEAAAQALAAARENSVRPLYGGSTQQAVRAWPYLDTQARLDWIWVCKFVSHTWIRPAQMELAAAM